MLQKVDSTIETSPIGGGESSNPANGPRPVDGYVTRLISARNGLFLLLAAVSPVVFYAALRTLVHYALWGSSVYDQYSYTLLIPFISLALAYSERRKIFASVQYGWGMGLLLLLTAPALNWFAGHRITLLGAEYALSIQIAALVLFWLGAFILCFGTRAFQAGAFALWFLVLTVPLPDALIEKPILAVRSGSTEVCALILSVLGVPFQRQGFEFDLPHLSIFVAKECSGIHSTFAIIILSLIAGHIVLVSWWKKLALAGCAIPIVCVTNGLRIAVLTLLAEYVDPRVLQSDLHRKGGMFFFLLAMLLLFAILHFLRRGQDGNVGVVNSV